MARDLFATAIEALESAARDFGDEAQPAALAALEQLSGAEGRQEDFRRFEQIVGSLRQSLRDSLVSERGLSLLIDTTHDLSSTLQVEGLLRTIVTRARSLVGANVAWVTVFDDESGLFRTVNAEGYLSPATTAMKSHVDYGAVSLIMKSKSYFVTQDYLGDQRFRHLPELDRVFQTENIVSLAGFPMLADGDVHGFLFVADRYSRKLTGRELSVLGSFALHAGVAMRNANAFRMLSEALDEAQRNRTALIDHIQRVEATAAMHDEMASLLASGAELGHFLRRMAGQIDGAIFLYDEELRVREEFISATYQGLLAPRLKAGQVDAALLLSASSQSRHTGRSVVMAGGDGGEVARVITLHGGSGRGECLVVCSQGELDAMSIRNLERNAVALAIAKLWNEKRETEKLIASSTLLRHLVLVTPPDPATISAVRERLSLGADEPVMMALVSIAGLDRTGQTAIVRECASGANLLVDLLQDTYLAIGTEKVLRGFLRTLEKRRQGWTVGGILSEAISDLTAAPVHYGRMTRALAVLREMKRLDHFVEQSEVNLFAKIFEAGDAARLARYMADMLTPIHERAPKQSRQLKQTLLCYFESQHNIKRVAKELGLHVNTVRQRLDTLREITGGWDDPVNALELHLALRLDAILDGERGGEA